MSLLMELILEELNDRVKIKVLFLRIKKIKLDNI